MDLGDERLNRRVVNLAEQLAAQPMMPINQACEDWADTKAAYRLFANEKVSVEKLLAPHQKRTQERMGFYRQVLAVQDTTVFNYTHHPKTAGLGPIGTTKQEQQGMLMHSTLTLTPAGMPLGVLTQDIWVRPEEPVEMSKEARRQRPIEEKESYKWLKALQETVDRSPEGTQVITVCDREGDIFEFFVEANRLSAPVLVRSAQNRSLLPPEEGKLWEAIERQPIAGYLKIQVPAQAEQPAREAIVSVRFGAVTLKPPRHLASTDRNVPQPLSAILVQEIDPPEGVTPLDWRLLTNLPVLSFEEAVECIGWYRCRWHIEVFHKVIKSGCRVEDCRLGQASRLQRFLTLFSIIAWRLYWLTHINRHYPDEPCTVILTDPEWQALYATIHRSPVLPQQAPTVYQAVRWIAQLGGFLGRKGDGEPGITVIWRGWQRLSDIASTWQLLHPPPS